jgi:hypothetical protein
VCAADFAMPACIVLFISARRWCFKVFSPHNTLNNITGQIGT